MKQPLNLDAPLTWPTDILQVLEAHLGVFRAWEESTGNAYRYDQALDALRDVLGPHTLVGYHCTRLTDAEVDAILKDGVELVSGGLLARRIDSAVVAGQLAAEHAEQLKAKHDGDAQYRAGMTWFCFFEPHIAGEHGIGDLVGYWGGEALYRNHDRSPVLGPILSSLGHLRLWRPSSPSDGWAGTEECEPP